MWSRRRPKIWRGNNTSGNMYCVWEVVGFGIGGVDHSFYAVEHSFYAVEHSVYAVFNTVTNSEFEQNSVI